MVGFVHISATYHHEAGLCHGYMYTLLYDVEYNVSIIVRSSGKKRYTTSLHVTTAMWKCLGLA